MSEVKSVTVELRTTAGARSGRVTEGYYTVDGNQLSMTTPDGAPIADDGGNPLLQFQHTLKDGEFAPAIACALTHKVRAHLLGETDFNRPINYSSFGVA